MTTNILELYNAYESIYYTEQNIFDDIVGFCLDANIFESIEETEYFANLIIDNDLVETFVDDVFEYCFQEQLLDESYITEVSAGAIVKGLKLAGGLFKKAAPAARGLSTKTMVKQGLRPTALSSKGKPLSGAAKADDIARTQAARAARKPPAPEEANKYGEMLAQKKAATPAPTPKPTTKPGGMTPSYVAKRGVTDTLATTLALGMGHMAGLKPATNVLRQMSTPVVRTVTTSASRTAPTLGRTAKGAAADPWKQFPKKPTAQKGLPKEGPSSRLPNRTLTGAPSPKALPAAGQTSAPKPRKPSGAATDPWKQFPKKPTSQKGLPKEGPSSRVPNRTLSGSPEPKGLLPSASKTGLSPEGQAIQRLNKMTGGGPLGTTKLPRSTAAPKPAWGPDASPKPATAPGQAQRSIVAPSTKPATKPSQKTPEPPTGGGKPPRGGGLTHTVRATLSPTEKTGNMKYPGLEKYATGSGPGTGGAKPPRRSMVGPAAAAAAGIAAGVSASKDSSEKAPQKKIKTDVYNTMDPSGKIRSRLKVGPAKIGDTFEDAFRFYRKKGDKTFDYAGKKYTTDLAKENVEDVIIDYLLSEGYATTHQGAYNIMNNMGEEWKKFLFEV